jgi:transposase
MYDTSKENNKEFLKELNRHLQEKVLFLEKEVQQLRTLKQKDEEISMKLAEELHALRKRFFDSKQERNPNKPKDHKKRKSGKLPHNQNKNQKVDEQEVALEEAVIEYKIDDSKCLKCGEEGLKVMNNCFEESSEFEVVERRYILKRHKRQKYSCKCCQNISTAPGGVKLTPGAEFSIQMATQIACDKFEVHLPLERQRKQMHQAGLAVEVKTLYGLTEHLYNLLSPLQEMIRQDVLSEMWVHLDESPIDFYNPNKSKGYVWSMSNARGAYYQFEPTRAGEVAKEMLKGYEDGNVMTDGYSGYNFLALYKNLKHAFCWAHVRRKFYEAMAHSPEAEVVIDLIDKLYEVEHMADNLFKLKDLRLDNSVKIVKAIDEWIDSMDGKFLDTSSLGKAINYYLGRKMGLHLFLYNENIPIDNNMAERRQRCPVMGRKNFLHFKSINGADVGVFFYSVIESCKSNGLNPRAFINEMAHRSVNKQKLESPYQYSCRLNEEITQKMANEFAALKESS